MNRIHKRRLTFIVCFVSLLSLSLGLILFALQKNINVFLTPSQLLAAHLPSNYTFRLGGVVKKHSVVRETQSIGVRFVVTDYKKELLVYYQGILPDLFREGKGVVVEGTFNHNQVTATQVLAKHDENYMPKKIYQQLREST
jgi:cytochrome c-type biogenesis protein CcmE